MSKMFRTSSLFTLHSSLCLMFHVKHKFKYFSVSLETLTHLWYTIIVGISHFIYRERIFPYL